MGSKHLRSIQFDFENKITAEDAASRSLSRKVLYLCMLGIQNLQGLSQSTADHDLTPEVYSLMTLHQTLWE